MAETARRVGDFGEGVGHFEAKF